jgi:TolA-binding protein
MLAFSKRGGSPTLRRAVRAGAPALLLVLAGCWVPLERGRVMEERLDKLEADAVEQQRALKERITAADRKIAEVQAKIDELNQAARRSGADLGVSVTRLQDELAKAKGELEVQQHRLGEIERSLSDVDARTDKRFAALRGRGALDEAEAAQKIQGLSRPDDRAAFLALAKQEDEQGSPGVARELYDEYYRRFPKDPSAVDAALRSGELAANQRRWKESFIANGWVYKNAPRSERLPDSMLGMANAMLELEELRADAPALLREIVQKYPKTQAAAKAKAKLAQLAPAKKKAKPKKK